MRRYSCCHRVVLGLTALWLCACVSATSASVVSASTGQTGRRDRAGDDLPAGPGKTLLRTACLICHDLGEVTKFRGYYSRAQWRDVVMTMVEYGAPLSKDDVEVLADYLAANLGRTQ
jgi:cytochrome c5